MVDLNSVYNIKDNLDHYILQVEHHIRYLESYGDAPVSQAHHALNSLRVSVDEVVQQIEEEAREVEANKKIAHFNQENDWNKKYMAAYDLYYIGKLEDSEKMMRQIASAKLEKTNPELHKCALQSLEEIGRAKTLKHNKSTV